MRTAFLCGRDHAALGAVDTVAEGRLALAISRGGAVKTYAHLADNEDAALFAEGAAGQLVAVADGHSGDEGSQIALRRILERWAESWTEMLGEPVEGWPEALRQGVEDAHAAVYGLQEQMPGRAPRTTLALALVRPEEGRLLVARVGDSHLFLAGEGRPRDLASDPTGKLGYLGARAGSGRLPREIVLVAEAPLGPRRALVAVTDGLSEPGIGVEDPAAAVQEAVAEAADAPLEMRALAVARGVTERALRAQRRQAAGDNVAAAAVWLDPEPGTGP